MEELINFFMDPLRLTLIVAGVAVLLAIIIFSRKSRKRNEYVYSMPSSKEFSFGAQNQGGVSDALARDTLVDEEIIVLPRKQKESETSQPEMVIDDATVELPIKSSIRDRSQTNAYQVRTEPKGRRSKAAESAVSEFNAFQASSVENKAGSDVFEDEILTSPTPFVAYDSPVVTTKKSDSMPQFQQAEKAEAIVSVSVQEETVKTVEKTAKKLVQEKTKTSESVSALPKEMFVVLHIIAIEGNPFNGLGILEATKTQGMAFGKHAIFHYPMSAAPAGDSKFCLVNMSATGNFESNKMADVETNGISLIMRLPIRGADAMIVFSNMVGVAQALARKLGGEILDQSRVPLTPEIVEDLRVDIASFDSSLKYATSKESAVPEI